MTSGSRQCLRFTREGDRCQNMTISPSGWCGHLTLPGVTACPGFLTPQVGALPEVRERPRIKLGDLPLRLTQRAIQMMASHYDLDYETAKAELALTCQALRTGSYKASGEFTRIHLRGFYVTMASDNRSIVAFESKHRERTPSQVFGAVASRISPGRAAPPAEVGPEIDEQAMRDIDLAPLFVTRSANYVLSRILKEELREKPREEKDRIITERLWQLCDHFLDLADYQRDERGNHVFTLHGLRLTFSRDGAILYSVHCEGKELPDPAELPFWQD